MPRSGSTDITPQAFAPPVTRACSKFQPDAAGCVGESGKRIERPFLRARHRVEGADDAALEIGRAVVADRGADDDHVVEHGGRGGDDVVRTIADAYALREIDLAVRAEIRAGLDRSSHRAR